MIKYLLIAFSSLFIISCAEDIQEEYLVESNDNLFPKDYFSNRYFVNGSSHDFDSVQIKYDDLKRPIEKNIRSFGYPIGAQKVNYINDSEYEISEGGVIIETGTYQLKNYFKDIIIQKLTSVKDDLKTLYTYEPIEGDTVLKSIQVMKDTILISKEDYEWIGNSKYPHLTNLESITQINTDTNYKTITTFKYDGVQNPFIRLGIFDDINNRHLSFNNYIKKTIKVFDKNNNELSSSEYNTNFKYKNGKVDLTK